MFPELSVYENIFFGHEIVENGIINWNKTIIEAEKMLKRLNLDIDPTVKIKTLGVGTRQLIEIAKALSKDVKLLILDEPTSALNEDDSENLLRLIRELKEQGVTSIMISHKLKEVVEIADTITILRDGATVTSLNCKENEITEQEIIPYMVGREIEDIYPKRDINIQDELALEVKNWTMYHPTSGRLLLDDVSFNIKKGEIVGLAGLMGAGRTEMAMSLFGNVPKYRITNGELWVNGEKKQFKTTKDAMKAGLAYVTEDRKKNGLVLIQDIQYNITLGALEKLTEGLVINEHEERIVANEYKDNIHIVTPSIQQKVSNLSGGNQQKVSLSKWLFTDPSILILDEPTRGIDVGAKFEIYSLMNQLVEQGMSILMISSELLEVLGMSDRIYVLSEGSITGEILAKDATEERIMAMATKTQEEEKDAEHPEN